MYPKCNKLSNVQKITYNKHKIHISMKLLHCVYAFWSWTCTLIFINGINVENQLHQLLICVELYLTFIQQHLKKQFGCELYYSKLIEVLNYLLFLCFTFANICLKYLETNSKEIVIKKVSFLVLYDSGILGN